MKWYRSWPSDSDLATIPPTTPRIIDDLPKLIMAGQNYKTVTEYNSIQSSDGWPDEKPGFCMLEWDMALDDLGKQLFASQALIEPREALVAPYRFWDTWCMWQGNDGSGPTTTEHGGRPIQQGETRCDSFGLGCIYIPRIILNEFLAQMNKFGFTDGTFGKWYRTHYGQIRVTWDVHPQHLHNYPQ